MWNGMESPGGDTAGLIYAMARVAKAHAEDKRNAATADSVRKRAWGEIEKIMHHFLGAASRAIGRDHGELGPQEKPREWVLRVDFPTDVVGVVFTGSSPARFEFYEKPRPATVDGRAFASQRRTLRLHVKEKLCVGDNASNPDSLRNMTLKLFEVHTWGTGPGKHKVVGDFARSMLGAILRNVRSAAEHLAQSPEFHKGTSALNLPELRGPGGRLRDAPLSLKQEYVAARTMLRPMRSATFRFLNFRFYA